MSLRRFLQGASAAILLLTAACQPGTIVQPDPAHAGQWIESKWETHWPGDDVKGSNWTCPLPQALSNFNQPIPCTGTVVASFHIAGGVKFSDGEIAEGSMYELDQPLSDCKQAPCPPGGGGLFFGSGPLVPYPGAAGIPYTFSFSVVDRDNSDGSQSGPNELHLSLCPSLVPAVYCGTVFEPAITESFTCNDSGGKQCVKVTLAPTGTHMSVDRRTLLPRLRSADLHPLPARNLLLLQRALQQRMSPGANTNKRSSSSV